MAKKKSTSPAAAFRPSTSMHLEPKTISLKCHICGDVRSLQPLKGLSEKRVNEFFVREGWKITPDKKPICRECQKKI